jgi:hypothetical protein
MKKITNSEYIELLKQYDIKGETEEQVIPVISKKLDELGIGVNLRHESFDLLMMLLRNITCDLYDEDLLDNLALEVAAEENKDNYNKLLLTKKVNTVTTKSKNFSFRIKPYSNNKDKVYFSELMKKFPTSEYLWDWLVRSGVSVKHKGLNNNRIIFAIEGCFVTNGEISKCNLFMESFNKQEHIDMIIESGYDFVLNWNNIPVFKKITLTQAIDIIEYFKDYIINQLSDIDKKLGYNRKKMESMFLKENIKNRYNSISKDSWLLRLDKNGLKTFIRDNKLGIVVNKNWDDSKIRKEIELKSK